jgi:hypothetical protein
VLKFKVPPTQTGELLVGDGAAGGLTIVTEVVPTEEVHPASLTVRL